MLDLLFYNEKKQTLISKVVFYLYVCVSVIHTVCSSNIKDAVCKIFFLISANFI